MVMTCLKSTGAVHTAANYYLHSPRIKISYLNYVNKTATNKFGNSFLTYVYHPDAISTDPNM